MIMADVVWKIIGICILCSATVLILKDILPSYVPVVTISTGALCWYIIFPYIKSVLLSVQNLSDAFYDLSDYFVITSKIIGISVLCQFACELCDDMGQGYLSSKIEFGGKLIIITICIPEFLNLINTIVGMINSI